MECNFKHSDLESEVCVCVQIRSLVTLLEILEYY